MKMYYQRLAERFLFDEDGQDLIEYGLLLGIFSSALVVVMPALQTRIHDVFNVWGTQANDAHWIPVDPQ